MKFERLSIARVADNNGKTCWWSKTKREQRMGWWLITAMDFMLGFVATSCFALVLFDVLLSCHCGDNSKRSTVTVIAIHCAVNGWTLLLYCVLSFFTVAIALNDCLF